MFLPRTQVPKIINDYLKIILKSFKMNSIRVYLSLFLMIIIIASYIV